jgi:hypothetical protein
MNVADELAKLAQLRDQGVLSPEEFEQQKAAVLAGGHPAGPTTAAKAAGKKPLAKGCLIVLAVLIILFVLAAIIGGANKGEVVAPKDGSVSSSKAGEATSEVSEPGLTMAGYNRIENGMTFEQVTAIIGQPSQEMSRNEMAGTETVMYMWEGSLGANMNAMFQNGKLVQKAQFGLR